MLNLTGQLNGFLLQWLDNSRTRIGAQVQGKKQNPQ